MPDFQENLYKMLLQMQHRGQLSAGITTLKKNQDFLLKTHKELIANDKNEEKITQAFGVNSVRYQTISGLTNAINLNKEDLCFACINGEYPTKAGKSRAK